VRKILGTVLIGLILAVRGGVAIAGRLMTVLLPISAATTRLRYGCSDRLPNKATRPRRLVSVSCMPRGKVSPRTIVRR
jgi:hypothetical protein